MEQFPITLWNNGGDGWGITVGKVNVRKHFPRNSPVIHVHFNKSALEIHLDRGKDSETFWGTCPEFRHPEFKHWTARNGITKENKRRVEGTMTKISDGQWRLNLSRK